MQAVSENLPTRAYFLPKQGRWRGVVRFRVTSWRRFWAAPMRWLERLGVLAMALIPNAIAATRIETTVDCAPAEVVHTTQLSKWGFVFFRSVERFVLHDNGRDFTVRGEQRQWPTWSAEEYRDSHGQVDAAGERASYVFSLLGGVLHQCSEPAGDALQFHQTTDWSSSDFLLRQVSTAKPTASTPAP